MVREILASQLIETPFGAVLAAASDVGVVSVEALGDREVGATRAALAAHHGATVVEDAHPHLRLLSRQLVAWARGRRHGFSVPLDLRGTAFQRRVWEALRGIPQGQTATYAEVATRIGQPSAFRAVANACGRNPVLVLVPCHRVVASGGGLGGFSAGLPLKRRLLAIERGGADTLPLFRLVEEREAEREAEEARTEVMSDLPTGLRSWWLHRTEGRPLPGAAATTAEAWLAHVLEVLPVDRWPELIGALHEGARRAPDPTLALLAGEAADLFTLRCREAWPEPEVLARLLVVLEAHEPERVVPLALTLLGRPRLPARLREALSVGLGALVGVSRDRAPHLTDAAVDLWTAARAGDGEASWRAAREEEPSEALMRAGLFREAAQAGETALATGRGDRRVLLARLAEAYEHLEAWDLARERLASLALEDPGGDLWQRRLRRLEDRARHGA